MPDALQDSCQVCSRDFLRDFVSNRPGTRPETERPVFFQYADRIATVQALEVCDSQPPTSQPMSGAGTQLPVRSLRTRCHSMGQKISPCPALRPDRDKSGMGVRQALFPVPTLGAHLAVAAGFPTLFSTASGVFGLVAGPSSALRSLDY